jgi:mannitol-1-phosphate 5-dehydrogenase
MRARVDEWDRVSERQTAVVFGAGSVGRGFLGQLFTESGYAVVFVDIDQLVVQTLANQGRYRLHLVNNEEADERIIEPVTAFHVLDTERVADAVASAPLLATAVGSRALTTLADPIAAGLTLRWQRGVITPQTIIICENLRDAPHLLRDAVCSALPSACRQHLDERVGWVPAVIARMSPVPTSDQRTADPTLIIAEPYKVLPVDRGGFVGPIPNIVGLEAVSPFKAYMDRKLYVHNAGHSVLGYLGYLHGYEYGYQAAADARVRELVEEAMWEASRALIAEYRFDPRTMHDHVSDLLTRFSNMALADPISRLARDPLRKLAPGDRLVGAARLAERHNIEPIGLAWGIAAGLAYDSPDDIHAQTLQARILREGVQGILQSVCGIRADEPLGESVARLYAQLRIGSRFHVQ